MELDLTKINKTSKEYKTAVRNMIKSDCFERYSDGLENGWKISNKEISSFCAEYKEYGSENYIRAIIVPMLLENFGDCIK